MNDVAQALAEVLSGPLTAPVEVVSVERLSAGASAQLRALVVRDGDGAEHALVARPAASAPTTTCSPPTATRVAATLDPAALRWWVVLATLKWGVVCQVQAGRHLAGARSVEHAVIGRRVSETELDLLLLLEDAR